jgi:hypothetical protein
VLDAAGQVDSPLLVAVILSATSLGIVIPVLKDGVGLPGRLRPSESARAALKSRSERRRRR